jgi:uncharacterized protein YndB with AHSA1/START domain
MATSDRIEKQVTLRAPVSRVWRALTDAREFSSWFGLRLEGDFAAGKPIAGVFDERLDEAAIMAHQKNMGLAPSRVVMPPPGSTFCTVERMEPERLFSFRWIPYGVDAEIDPTSEPTTLVEFRLEPVPEGTRLTITESGFDRVPAHRRERAFRMNEGGWAGQAENLRKHVES